MTNHEYQEARRKLHSSTSRWIDKLGITESAHKKYSSGDRKIPLYIQRHIETLTGMRYDRINSEQVQKLETLELTVRTINCLHSVGIETVPELTGCTHVILQKVPNLGKKSIDEIANRLSEKGLALGTPPYTDLPTWIR